MPSPLETLKPLLEQGKGAGLMVSAYLDAGSLHGPTIWPGPVKAKVTAVEAMLREDEPGLKEFEKNLRAIGKVLEAPELRHAPGVAVFAAEQRGFVQAFPLESRPGNDLVVHESPYLVPLLQATLRQREFMVVMANTHRARVSAMTLRTARVLKDLEGEIPRKQHSCGERWGKEQATIAQRRDDCIHRFHNELVAAVQHAWAEHPFQGMILLGEHETLEHVKKALPPRLASHVIAEAAQKWLDAADRPPEAVCKAMADHMEREERETARAFEERLHEGYGLAAGPVAVLEAITTGKVGPRGYGYLVLGPDLREVVARCQTCRALSTDMIASCPRCGGACVEANLWEELLLLAMKHGIAVRCLGANKALAGQGGVVAMLAEPRAAQAARALAAQAE